MGDKYYHYYAMIHQNLDAFLVAIVKQGHVGRHTDLRGISPEDVCTKRLTKAAEIPGRF